MADNILVQGNQMGWASLTVRVRGQLFTGFTGISFDEKLERTLTYGMGKAYVPRGITPGKYTPGVIKLTCPVVSGQLLRQALATGTSYGNTFFQVVLQYIERGSSELPMVVNFERCVFTGSTASHSEGTDALMEDIEAQPQAIFRNGLHLFSMPV